MKKAAKPAQVNYSLLQRMSTEDLRDLLRKDMDNIGESDMDLVFNVMEVLENREKVNNECNFTNTETALKQLHEQYDSFVGEANNQDKPVCIPKSTASRQSAKTTWFRASAAAAVIAIVLLIGTVTAEAMGYHIWDGITRWTKETLSFRSAEQPFDYSLAMGELESTLLDWGVTEPVLPKWLPDQYVCDDVSIFDSPEMVLITAHETAGDHSLLIHIIKHFDYLSENPQHYEVSDVMPKSYISHGIEHFVTNNFEHTGIYWKNGTVQVSLDFSQEDIGKSIEKIIESIYEE